MKHIILFTFLCCSLFGSAQTDIVNCTIWGKVIDLNKIPIEGATVILNSPSALNDTIKTNSDGIYCFNKNLSGSFDVYCFHTQYGEYKLGNQLIKKGDGNELETIQLDEIQVAEQKMYAKLVNKADESFSNKNYEKALELYKRANGFRPSDESILIKIEKTRELLNEE